MNESWKHLALREIALALYVAANTGKHIHQNRPFHGLVLNDAEGKKDYLFDDGTVLHTEGHSLFYLPKGSSYQVKSIRTGGCYAINFDADIEDAPFSFELPEQGRLLHHFRVAASAWKSGKSYAAAAAMRAVYDAVYQIGKYRDRQYLPNDKRALLAPAIEEIESGDFGRELHVRHLADLCSVSEVYFRRLFSDAYGISPKEYLIRRRIDYAKTLLRSGQFAVSEVARLSGYAEPCHFSREFTRRVGVSPVKFEE